MKPSYVYGSMVDHKCVLQDGVDSQWWKWFCGYQAHSPNHKTASTTVNLLYLTTHNDDQHTWYVNTEFYCIDQNYCIFWDVFTILTLLYNIEFYLQHVLQFPPHGVSTLSW